MVWGGGVAPMTTRFEGIRREAAVPMEPELPLPKTVVVGAPLGGRGRCPFAIILKNKAFQSAIFTNP